MTATAPDVPHVRADDFGDEGTLVVQEHFAIVPEWLIDADISDAAYRLYSVLLRYGQSSGTRMPSRALLARRLRRSVDSVDRALKELVAVGAVVIEHRRQGKEFLQNRYHLRTARPGTGTPPGGGRRSAATPPPQGGGRKSAATPGRTDAATLAADLRPNPVVPTQEKTPPPPSPPTAPRPAATGRRRISDDDVRELCRLIGIDDLETLAERCRAERRRLRRPTGLWTASGLAGLIHASIHEHGWPAAAVVPALLALAADPATKSPARLPCAGPWWESAETPATTAPADPELTALEARLAEADGARVALQRQARRELTAAGQTVTRLAVARRACALLDAAVGERS